MKPGIHILLIHQAFACLDEPGGTRHHELARYLAAAGNRVTVITSPISYLTGSRLAGSGAGGGRDVEDGIRVIHTRGKQSLHRSFMRRTFVFLSFMVNSFLAGLRVRQVDIIWGTSPPIFQGVTAWLLARLKGVPFLFEVRDLWPKFAVAVGVLRNRLLIRMSEWLERLLYRKSDLVVVNSPGYLDHVRERGARRVELVPNGADPGMFHPESSGATFRKQNKLGGNFVVLYAGAHGMSNDLGVILEAARLLNDQAATRQVRIVLLGDGKEKPALVEQARQMGLNNLLFLPPVPKTEMAEAMAAADVCLAILKPIEAYKTTYPNKVFDSMAAGRAVLLAIDGVIRQVVEKAGCGVFVPPGDPQALAEAIRRMAADPAGCRRMGQAGRQALEADYSRDRLAQKLLELLTSLKETGQ